MAKKGTMPNIGGAGPTLPGVPHFATKMPIAPKQRQNMLNIRVVPLKRMQTPVKPVKGEKPSNVGNF